MTPALFLAGMVAMGAALCWCAVRAWRVLEARPLRPLEAWVGRLASAAADVAAADIASLFSFEYIFKGGFFSPLFFVFY
jgi:hypothetical protein